MDLVNLIALAWLGFWLFNWLVNGRVWWWELVSVVPGWLWGILGVASILISISSAGSAGNLLAIIASLYTVPLWWPALDLNWRRKSPAGHQHPPTNPSSQFKLFNWNTEFWNYGNPEFYKFLQQQDADVYHLQEAWNRDLIEYDAVSELQPHFPEYKILQSSEFVTLTRLPVIKAHIDPQLPYLRTDIQIGDKVVSVYNVHITVHFVPGILRVSALRFCQDMKRRFATRKQQFKLLHSELNSNPHPFVVSGDFNTTRFMVAIRPFLHKYLDAFRANYRGIARTYYAGYRLRWWRLDYVLGHRVMFTSYNLNAPGKLSDHAGIVAEVSI